MPNLHLPGRAIQYPACKALFFETLASNAKITIHASVYGDNDHHKIEALFKAFAYAMKRAVKIEGKEVKSTKGTL